MGRSMSARAHGQLLPRRPVDPQQALPALELEVLARWRERDVFAQSLRARQGAPRWVFYEGPPTANAPPGTHHVLSRVFKDIYPRFQTMRGHLVERKGGWDCHGLGVEIAVEQKLGISSKAEIEQRIGIERFNEECRASVFAFLEDWDRLTERIGFWIDLDHAYRTLDESVFLQLGVSGGPERLLVWTTTPWTLPGNVAVAVSPTATYVLARESGET